MKKKDKQFLINSFIILIVLLIVVSLYLAFVERVEKTPCHEFICLEYTTDQFDDCKNLGRESTGFLSSEYFYLCDGIKMARECIEWDYVESNRSYDNWVEKVMRCD